MADKYNEYPDGKIRPADKGELYFKVVAIEGRVIMDWGEAVKWIAMTPSNARTVAESLMRQAQEAEDQIGRSKL
jgi:hypothetical protein